MSNIQLITKQLGTHIIREIETASTICIMTSFTMKSGVKFIKNALERAVSRNAEIKICTGDYLYITQPEALEELLHIDERIQIRFWRSNGISFHPKAYLFEREDSESLYVCSSNLSRSALDHGVEWNLSVSDEKEIFNTALDQFLKTFLADETVPLNEETLKDYKQRYEIFHKENQHLAKKWSDLDEYELMLQREDKEELEQPGEIGETREDYGEIQPRFAQLEALEQLNSTLEEDYKKALVIMATGLGKTYLAGFFAKKFKRVLFIAHREEILYQARKSFRRIMPEKKYGIYNGSLKEADADIIFASIYTLGMQRHINRFAPDHFDLIIVDEFHHAAADTYRRALNYFKPKFLLGITATPDRNDNKDVYAICDGNVAYRLDFLEAIERKWLSPFKYFGVYDDTDYSQITWLGNRYDEQELLQVQLRDEMADKILNAWNENRQTRTIGFCSSIRQANFLSSYFNKQGYKTVSLHSKQLGVGRKEAIDKLSKGEIDLIFTVDLFNEGVDIPTVDTLLFVRPTESLTVFTQQIGRGLRLAEGKEYCIIIDLIGNYRNADIKLSLFNKDPEPKGKAKKIQPVVPEMCEIDLDVKVINLLEEMNRKRQPRKDKLYSDYMKVKQELGRRPSYVELHLFGASDSRQYSIEFNSYFGFLEWAGELSATESGLFFRYIDWLKDVEKTDMKKSYKMVLLLAMLERGVDNWFKPFTPEEAAPFFHRYLTEAEYRKQKDFSDKGTFKLWEYDQKGVSSLIARMPMSKWSGNATSQTALNDHGFSLKFDVMPEDQDTLYGMTKEICEYRLHYYFARQANN
ncbi:DEAD/DEAH box helicase family protein [Peribacillus kribbensis]|uniref:DEAD/DEAH box helicase family protein n=1 Tax=Peribacillus kribbensis TaxID=356658 RepID=UPI0004015DC1|nr:DEAD/DEAH box helicase family protein [Peribacillus kribbensis]